MARRVAICDSRRVRFVTLNLWGERGPFERRLPLVIEGLFTIAADVVALQEVRDVPGKVPNMAKTIAEALRMEHVFAPGMEWGGGVEGVALLTRAPMSDVVARELPHATRELRRVVLAGRIESPEGTVRVATTHLNYRLEHGKEREDQVLAIDALLSERTDQVRVLLGDRNATPDSDEVRWLGGLTTLGGRRTFYQDAWTLFHDGPGHTWARENDYTHQMHYLQPGRRIDYVFVSPEERDGRARVLGCEIALDDPTDGIWPSDHYALVADVQAAPRPV
jgi:endonuclease/exonuclease/phosphatase family metal-dependent hydrolase